MPQATAPGSVPSWGRSPGHTETADVSCKRLCLRVASPHQLGGHPESPGSGDPGHRPVLYGHCSASAAGTGQLYFGLWRILCMAQIEHKRISSTLWLPTERVRRKGSPLAQAHCTPCAQAFGLCVWLTPPPLQAPMAACDPPGRCTDCVGHTAQNHCRFVSPHRRCPRCFQWGGQFRISPWTAEDLRAPLRLFTVTDLVAYATETNEWTLYVSLDDSLGAKDKDTRHLEAVAYHHDHTKSQGKKNPTTPMARCISKSAYSLGHARMPMTGGCTSGRRPCDGSTGNGCQSIVCTFARKPAWPATCWRAYSSFTCWVPGLCALRQLVCCQWHLKFCRRQGWHVICAIKSNRKFDDKKLSQWPQALRHQRYQRVQLTATDQRSRTYLVRTRRGKLSQLPCEVQCSSVNGTIGINTRSIFCVRIFRSRHSKSCRSIKSVGH